MKIVVTKFKDGTFCLSDGDSMVLVNRPYEAALWAHWKTKKCVRTIKNHVDSLGCDDMIEMTPDGSVSFKKIDYSKMFD